MKEVGSKAKVNDRNKDSVGEKMNGWERAAWNVAKQEEKQYKP